MRKSEKLVLVLILSGALAGCQTINPSEEQDLSIDSAAGMDLVSLADTPQTNRRDAQSLISELRGALNLCPNTWAGEQPLSPGERQILIDRYGRDYRALRAIRDTYREQAISADNASDREELGDAARNYDEILEEFPHPSEFCPESAEDESAEDTGSLTSGRDDGGTTVSIGFGLGEVEHPSTGIGFQRDGAPGTAPERFATEGSDNFGYSQFEVSVRSPNWYADMIYGDGDSRASSSIPGNSGVDSGIVYGELSPGGSSGIATPFGLDSEIETDIETIGVRGGHTVLSEESLNLLFRLSAEFSAMFADRDYVSMARGSGVSGGTTFSFQQDRVQDVDDFRALLGIMAQTQFNPRGTFSPWVRGRVGAYYYDTDLDSVENNSSNFGPAADQAFTVTIEDSRSGVGFAGSASAGIDVNVADNFTIGIGGGIDYLSDVGAIFNPNSGDQVFFDGRTTELQTEDMWNWYGMIRAIIRFGQNN
ncbi:hypothetical protein [Parasphingopyxis sp.]|uniref:hypothetical protein n=1 Tax=Parasphingopyxis sp. TaxID=1920299 RepID=UPI00262AFB1C|nr:hypothetical protein [Parasphingopyxis sp.]